MKILSTIIFGSIFGSLLGLIVIAVRKIAGKKMSGILKNFLWCLVIFKLIYPYVLFPAERNMPKLVVNMDTIFKAFYTEETGTLRLEVFKPNYMNFVFVIWIVGIIFVIIWFLMTIILFNKRLKNCSGNDDKKIMKIFSKAKAKIGVTRDVKILNVDFIGTPALYGILKPVILLPDSVKNVSDEETENILLHELSHLRRYDLIKNYIWIIICIFHWFNPLVWLFASKARDDIEIAADETAMRHIEEANADSYAKTLLDIEVILKKPASNMLCMANKSIKSRISSIIGWKERKGFERFVSLILCLVVVFFFFVGARTTVSALPIGDEKLLIGSNVIGYANISEAVVYIDGKEISAYDVDGTTCIICEDLENHGFKVTWDEENWTTYISGNLPQSINVLRNGQKEKVFPVYESTVKIILNGRAISPVYNIGGYTLIPLSEI